MTDPSDRDLAVCITLCYLTTPPILPLLLCLYLCYRQWEGAQKK